MIETARLLPGSETPVGDGTTGALRCMIELPDRRRCAAVLKRGPLGDVAAEAFGAALLRAWGLPMPTPYLVHEPAGLSFASAEEAYPSLRKRLGLDVLPPGPARDAAVRVGSLLASGMPSAGLATAADEAIENHDRNLGNILWDGTAEAWIDHAYALGRAPAHIGTGNKLCQMALHAGTDHQLRPAAVAQALALNRDAPHAVADALPAALSGPALAQRVAPRLARLAMLVLARFPQPQDLLSPP